MKQKLIKTWSHLVIPQYNLQDTYNVPILPKKKSLSLMIVLLLHPCERIKQPPPAENSIYYRDFCTNFQIKFSVLIPMSTFFSTCLILPKYSKVKNQYESLIVHIYQLSKQSMNFNQTSLNTGHCLAAWLCNLRASRLSVTRTSGCRSITQN